VRGKLVFGPPKSEAGKRTVTLPKAALVALRHHLEFNMDTEDDEELLFKGERGAPLRSSNFRRAVDWDLSVKAAGLPVGFHFHDLRHLGKRDQVIAAGIDRRLAEAAEGDERDDDSDGDGSSGVLVPVG